MIFTSNNISKEFYMICLEIGSIIYYAEYFKTRSCVSKDSSNYTLVPYFSSQDQLYKIEE